MRIILSLAATNCYYNQEQEQDVVVLLPYGVVVGMHFLTLHAFCCNGFYLSLATQRLPKDKEEVPPLSLFILNWVEDTLISSKFAWWLDSHGDAIGTCF